MILSLVVATMFWMQSGTLVEQLHDIFGRLGAQLRRRCWTPAPARRVAYCMIENVV
jgi:hypothetical protein